jgi:pullulanase
VAAFGQWKEILVLFNTGVDSKVVKLWSGGEWQVLVNETESGTLPITCHKGEEFVAAPVSAYVLAKM